MIPKPKAVPQSKELFKKTTEASQKDIEANLKELPMAKVNTYNIGL